MAEGKFIAYYRVSTQKQGRSGLGLEAQKKAVIDFLNGGSWILMEEFVEIESGKNNDRPQLQAALAACQLYGAKLVIAKLDRLARNVAFISQLMEGGVDFTAVDFPQANRLTIHVLSAVAEHEAAMISQRTKAALAAAKARGQVLGGFRGHVADDAARDRATSAIREKADSFAVRVRPTIDRLKADGLSLRGIAAELDRRGVATARGGAWTAAQVQRICRR